MKRAAGLLSLILLLHAPFSAQRLNDETAGDLRDFERDWLTAYLNDDSGWLGRFARGKLGVIPVAGTAFENRGDAVSELKGTDLQANEMKVRITGTISLLTNDPNRNRAFYFLDTFNKTGGKWRVIASSISPTPAAGARQAREELLKLESELARAIVTGDLATFERLVAPDFVSTSFDGRTEDRRQWIAASTARRVKSADLREVKVNLPGDNIAVVTGIMDFIGLNGNETRHLDRFTHTWSQRGGRWQCVAAHVTRIK